MIALDERGAKQNKSVGWARNMILGLFLTVTGPTRRDAVVGRREKDIFARRGIDEWRRSIIKSHRGDGGCECNIIHLCGGSLNWKSPDELVNCRTKSVSPYLAVQSVI
jgi:hypothetical protein